jgi:excisionase family DNA binding protein
MTIPLAVGQRGLLSTSQVANELGVHRSTVWAWVRTGALPAQKLGPKENFFAVRRADMVRFAKLWLRRGET